jgi:hypothetical protein
MTARSYLRQIAEPFHTSAPRLIPSRRWPIYPGEERPAATLPASRPAALAAQSRPKPTTVPAAEREGAARALPPETRSLPHDADDSPRQEPAAMASDERASTAFAIDRSAEGHAPAPVATPREAHVSRPRPGREPFLHDAVTLVEARNEARSASDHAQVAQTLVHARAERDTSPVLASREPAREQQQRAFDTQPNLTPYERPRAAENTPATLGHGPSIGTTRDEPQGGSVHIGTVEVRVQGGTATSPSQAPGASARERTEHGRETAQRAGTRIARGYATPFGLRQG